MTPPWLIAIAIGIGMIGCGDSATLADAPATMIDGTADTPADAAGCGDGSRAAGELCFAITSQAFVASTHVDLRILDADGQGGLDVAALVQVSGQNGHVRVALNAGTGTLSPLATASVGRPTPLAMVTGTMDAGTSVDLVIATPDRLVILRNNGAGDFGTNPATVSFGATALRDLDVAELEGDTDIDVIMSNNDGGGSVHVMNSNNGTSYGSNGRQTINETLAELELVRVDGDGDLDVIGIGEDGEVHVVTNGGTANYSAGQALAIGANPRALAIADLDGDGDRDALAVVDPSDVIVMTNTSGTLAAIAPIAAGGTAFDSTVGDFDGDGDLDLAVSDGAGDRISILRREGSGYLPPVSFTVGAAPHELAAGDLDGDGIADLVTLLADGTLVTLLSDP
jgi:hypothetical protein